MTQFKNKWKGWSACTKKEWIQLILCLIPMRWKVTLNFYLTELLNYVIYWSHTCSIKWEETILLVWWLKFVQHYCTMGQVNCKLKHFSKYLFLSICNQFIQIWKAGFCTHHKCFKFVYLCGFTFMVFFTVFFPGSYYLCVADKKHLSVSRSSVCRCIQHVTVALVAKKNDFIQFPNTKKAQEDVHKDFMVYCSIPSVIGAIDGTQIWIRKPVCEDWYQYLNWKSVTAINVGVSKFHFFKNKIYPKDPFL